MKILVAGINTEKAAFDIQQICRLLEIKADIRIEESINLKIPADTNLTVFLYEDPTTVPACIEKAEFKLVFRGVIDEHITRQTLKSLNRFLQGRQKV